MSEVVDARLTITNSDGSKNEIIIPARYREAMLAVLIRMSSGELDARVAELMKKKGKPAPRRRR